MLAAVAEREMLRPGRVEQAGVVAEVEAALHL
jgi:hypothetical protein